MKILDTKKPLSTYWMLFQLLTQEEKVKVSQLSDELSEMSSQLMVKEAELKMLKIDKKRLVEQFRDIKQEKKGEIILQVCYY